VSASAIWAEQGDHLSSVHVEADFLHGIHAAIARARQAAQCSAQPGVAFGYPIGF
jgi:hypothetical protein